MSSSSRLMNLERTGKSSCSNKQNVCCMFRFEMANSFLNWYDTSHSLQSNSSISWKLFLSNTYRSIWLRKLSTSVKLFPCRYYFMIALAFYFWILYFLNTFISFLSLCSRSKSWFSSPSWLPERNLLLLGLRSVLVKKLWQLTRFSLDMFELIVVGASISKSEQCRANFCYS